MGVRGDLFPRKSVFEITSIYTCIADQEAMATWPGEANQTGEGSLSDFLLWALIPSTIPVELPETFS